MSPATSGFASIPTDPEQFPLEHLEASRHDLSLQREYREAVGRSKQLQADLECPDCGPESELEWFYFRSPPWSWQLLCGRAGVVAFCDKHQRQVAFDLVVMN